MPILALALVLVSVAWAGESKAYMVVLGDSLSDQGNLFDNLDDALFGDPFGILPTENYYQGRFSNGPNWVDYLANENPSLEILNLAVGGAFASTYSGRDNALDTTLEDIPLLGRRLAREATGFEAEVAELLAVPSIPDTAAIWIGGNDLLNYTENGFANAELAIEPILESIDNALDAFARKGIDQFLLFNLPDLGATPGVNSDVLQAQRLREATVALNQGIAELSMDVRSSGSDVVYIDVFSRFDSILADPAKFGFDDIMTGCLDSAFDDTPCPNPDAARVFWDDVHPTTQVHALIAELVIESLQGDAQPEEFAVPLSSHATVILLITLLGLGLVLVFGVGSQTMSNETIRSRVLAGENVFGAMVFEFFTPGIAQCMKNAGAEFIIYDMEHTGFGFESLKWQVAACRGLGVSPMVRVPRGEYHFVARALDVGARGVMVPMVNGVEDAKGIAEAMRYPPRGRRGAAFGFAHDDYAGGSPVEKMQAADNQNLLIAQIETELGLEAVEEIAALEEIDVLWLGHFDLTNFLGIPGQFDHPLYLEAVARVVEVGRRYGKGLGFMASDPDWARDYREHGFNMLACGTDQSLLTDGASSIIESVAERNESKR